VATVDFNVLDKFIARYRLSKVTDEIDEGDVVLDFGCGSQGYFLKTISDKIKYGEGLDANVKTGKIGNLVFKKFKYTDKLPQNNSSFDKVVMLAVLEHIIPNEVFQLFKEFCRILKSGGKVILTTPTPASKKFMETLAKFGIINREEVFDHKKYYSKEEMEVIADENSLKLESYQLFEFGLNSVAIFKKN
jgi:cyclopropane fatty-acyl-phospholipid synthase-like methyltransferase